MLYKCLKRMIEKGNYESKEAMADKIAILIKKEKKTQTQYKELVDMIEA